MKKIFFLVACFMIMATAAFALDMSVGAGLEYADSMTTVKQNGGGVGEKDDTRNTIVNSFGGFLFFDAAYAELDFSVSGQSGAYFPLGDGYVGDSPVSTTSIGFSLLGKYPIKAGSFTIFPLLGLDYKIVVAGKDGYGNKLKDGDKENVQTAKAGDYGVIYYTGDDVEDGKVSDFSNLWLKFGVGADFNINKSMYLRSEWLYGIQLANTAQTKSYEYTPSGQTNEVVGITNGMTFKLAVGYRFGGSKSVTEPN
jgi:hypothetical protein